MGRVYWITGLSGAGKTTIGTQLYKKIKQDKQNIVLLDGDRLREVFGNDLGYSEADRLKCAMRYSRICKMLAEQGIDVICCTISMFDEIRDWNKTQIEDYIEIYVEVSMDILNQRNQKGLYEGADKGIVEDVVGKDIKLQLPKSPDFIIKNDGVRTPLEIADEIIQKFNHNREGREFHD